MLLGTEIILFVLLPGEKFKIFFSDLTVLTSFLLLSSICFVHGDTKNITAEIERFIWQNNLVHVRNCE